MSETKSQKQISISYVLPEECCGKTAEYWKNISNNCIKFLKKEFTEEQQKAIIDVEEELVAYDIDGDGEDGVLISNEFYTVHVLLFDTKKKKKYINMYSGEYEGSEYEPPLCYRTVQKVRRNTVKLENVKLVLEPRSQSF